VALRGWRANLERCEMTVACDWLVCKQESKQAPSGQTARDGRAARGKIRRPPAVGMDFLQWRVCACGCAFRRQRLVL
jgi:hypothetical protein